MVRVFGPKIRTRREVGRVKAGITIRLRKKHDGKTSVRGLRETVGSHRV